jgi:hypothetical protein
MLHSLALTGSTGDYGRRLSAVVIGFGATAVADITPQPDAQALCPLTFVWEGPRTQSHM